MKKIIALILSAVLVMGLAGCGENRSSTLKHENAIDFDNLTSFETSDLTGNGMKSKLTDNVGIQNAITKIIDKNTVIETSYNKNRILNIFICPNAGNTKADMTKFNTLYQQILAEKAIKSSEFNYVNISLAYEKEDAFTAECEFDTSSKELKNVSFISGGNKIRNEYDKYRSIVDN